MHNNNHKIFYLVQVYNAQNMHSASLLKLFITANVVCSIINLGKAMPTLVHLKIKCELQFLLFETKRSLILMDPIQFSWIFHSCFSSPRMFYVTLETQFSSLVHSHCSTGSQCFIIEM